MQALGPIARWLPDIAANLLAVAIVLLALLARLAAHAPPPPEPLPQRILSGAEITEALRQRLLPGNAQARYDLDAAGLHLIRPGNAPAQVYILSAARYDAARRALPGPWQEIPVPEALRPEGQWAAGFLALGSRAADPARFRRSLRALLEKGGSAPPPRRSASALLARAGAALDLLGLVLGLGLLRLLYGRSNPHS